MLALIFLIFNILMYVGVYEGIYSLCREARAIINLRATSAALTKIPRTFLNFASREIAPNSSGIRSHGVCEIPTRCVIMHFFCPPKKKNKNAL